MYVHYNGSPYRIKMTPLVASDKLNQAGQWINLTDKLTQKHGMYDIHPSNQQASIKVLIHSFIYSFRRHDEMDIVSNLT